jgi:hypothetical protein
MANKVFGKRYSRLLARFFNFFITAHLPLRQTCAEGRRLQRELRQADRHLHPIIVVKKPQVIYNFFSQIMSYILNMLICVDMILLDNLLQYFPMIDLSRTCDSITSLIYYALAMCKIYSWIKIKIKIKVLIFQQIDDEACGHRRMKQFL